MEDSQGKIIVYQRKVMKICEAYITDLYDRAHRSENTDVGPEKGIDADQKTYILNSVIDKAINEVRNMNTTGDNDVPGTVL
jgi:hypothetical protein